MKLLKRSDLENHTTEQLCHRFFESYIGVQFPSYRFSPHNYLISDKLQALESGEIRRLMIFMPPRHGKSCSDFTDLQTPDGLRKHGDLKVGDYVFGIDGKPTRITWIAPKSIQNLEVEFTNGEKIKCHENHEWTVWDRSYGEWKTVETKYFIRTTKFGKQRKLFSGNRFTYQLPLIQPLQFPKQNLSMHPYALGAWLGDGNSEAPKICASHEDEVVLRAVVACGYTNGNRQIHNTTGVIYQYYKDGMLDLLRDINVLNNKHIPDIYKYSSIEQRLQLLAGLIDTDGSLESETGRVRIVTADPILACDIKELVRSFGWHVCHYKQKPCTSSSGIIGKKEVSYLGFQPTLKIPTRVPRKEITRLAPQRRISIKSVTECDPEPGNSISVDRSDGLYLVGKTLIPTHNTMQVSEFFPAWYLGRNPSHQIIAATYSYDRAGDVGRKVRNQMIDSVHKAVFPDCVISIDSKGANKLATDQGGQYYSVGVGGAIVGRGANLFIIDDPIKSREDAESLTSRKKIIEWFKAVAFTRLMPDNRIVIVMCLTGDTPILMSDGSWKLLKFIRENDKILSYQNGKHVSRKVTNWISQGIDEVFTVFTDNHSVCGNSRHPFLVKKEDSFQWIPLSDLKKNDEIVISRKILFRNKARLSKDEAWLLGFMFGDGWVTINNKTNYNNNIPYKTKSWITCVAKGDKPDIIDKILALFKKIFNANLKDTDYGYYRTEIADVGRYFYNLGVYGGAKNKRIPKFLFSQPLYVRQLFLNGFNKADGCALENRFYFCNANPELIQDIRFLARSCGYAPSRINIYNYRKKAPNSPKEIKSINARFSMKDTFINDEFITTAVRKIIPAGEQEVFDLEVEDSENFIADGMVVHNTRWHFDDLAGRILDEGKEQWDVLSLPAIAEDHDQIKRKIGEALWPSDYPVKTLENIKQSIGSREWNSQYQQRPLDEEGGMVKLTWFKRYDERELKKYEVACFSKREPPTEKPFGIYKIVLSWDTAFKESELNDPSSCTVWGIAADGYYLLHAFNKRMGFPALKRRAIGLYDRYMKYNIGSIAVLIEDRASGQSLIQVLDVETRIPVIAIRPDANKVIRTSEISPIIEAGHVHLPENAPWLIRYETQIAQFPLGREDDDVDSTTQFLRWVSKPRYKRSTLRRFWK